jgi:hypothetical protein
MARPKKECPDWKDERDEELFLEYQKIIAGYGDLVRYIAKSKLYSDAAKKFCISEARARVIIQEMLRKKTGCFKRSADVRS